MRIAMFATLLATGACASSGPSGTAPTPASQTIGVVAGAGANQRINITQANAAHVLTLPYSADQIWRALPSVFDSLGIPIQTMEPAKRTIGNTGFSVRRRLKETPLSRYIDCGTTAMGPSADDYQIRLMVLSEVRPTAAAEASITTTVEASGRPANYSQDYSLCNSRGGLEARLIELLKARLAAR